MAPRMIIFLSIVTAVFALSSAYLGSRFIAFFQIPERSRVWVVLGFVAFVLIQFVGAFSFRHWGHFGRPHYFQWFSYLLMGLFSVILIFTLFYDVGLKCYDLFLSAWFSPDTLGMGFRRFGYGMLMALALGCSFVGWLQSVTGPKVHEVDIPVAGLPPALEGFRIAQISDLHVGPLIGNGYVKRVVEMANSHDPDLVVLTGDMVDGSVQGLSEEIAPLVAVKNREGIFLITGNHEYYSGVDEWLKYFRERGVQVLINEHRVIARGEARLVAAGVPDASASRMVPEHVVDPKKAFAGAPRGGGAIRILLSHQPKGYDEAEAEGVHLQLSGHTHGGQYFPWSLIVAVAYRFHRGLSKWKDMWIYVSGGAGYWGPPNRFAIPSEVTLIRLRHVSV